jgi:hypothetical protein
MWIQEFVDEAAVDVKILYNDKLEIGTVNTTYICESFVDITTASFRLTLCHEIM